MFQNQIERFQTVLKRTLTNTCMLEFSNMINTKAAKFSNASPTWNIYMCSSLKELSKILPKSFVLI